MPQTVLITGTGRAMGLGFNLVKRYLENGDTVFASVRRPSEALEALEKDYAGRLHILTMDISSTESVNAAAREAEKLTGHLDQLRKCILALFCQIGNDYFFCTHLLSSY